MEFILDGYGKVQKHFYTSFVCFFAIKGLLESIGLTFMIANYCEDLKEDSKIQNGRLCSP